MSEAILVVDDERVLRDNLCEFLRGAGYRVDSAADGLQAWAMLERDDYGVLLTDVRMPGLDGIGLLQRVVAARPETRTLVMTAYASVETAVEALRLGAYDYVLKPLVFEELLQKIRNLLRFQALEDEVVRLRRDLHREGGYAGIIGDSPAMAQVFEHIDRAAPTDTTVLVTGESGTGKELVARALHGRSQRADRPFLAVNVAAIAGDLVEAQLFGHEKGAFTGAAARREGLLRAARKGTVFLDEIGELSLANQAKLLRALELGEVLPVGADRPVIVDFRLLAATNRSMQRMVDEGTFRADLFYRLDVFRIELPPLRKRVEDIAVLARHFLRLHGQRQGRVDARISHDALRQLQAYAWPGNVRELSNVIERGLILAGDGAVCTRHLPAALAGVEQRPTILREAVDAAECEHIRWVIELAEGDRERAAELLGVDRATLYRRLRKHRLG